ncbi:hypothetical protein [Nitrosomonas sp. wSCUT-2]
MGLTSGLLGRLMHGVTAQTSHVNVVSVYMEGVVAISLAQKDAFE